MAINGLVSYGLGRSSRVPDPKREYSVLYERLDGGLNIYEMEYRLKPNESPDMQNLFWVDGALGCRYGQTWLSDNPTLGKGHTCYKELFWGRQFFHIGAALYYADPDAAEYTLVELTTGVPEVRGTFFRYQDDLFYKTRGAYTQITYDPDDPLVPFTAAPVNTYAPITHINCTPENGSGDSYQPENRINATKTLWYNAALKVQMFTDTGNGTNKTFTLGYTSASQARLSKVFAVYVDGVLQSTAAYTVDLATGIVAFLTAPASGAVVSISYGIGVFEYKLPVIPDSVGAVVVDGATLVVGTDYTVDLEAGKIAFAVSPQVTDPATNNTVKVTYTKANAEAEASIMDCVYAQVYGGDQQVCVVMGGSLAQPNAYFWNGNHTVMDPGYFPMPQYNLAGDTEEKITGFGRQQAQLIIFKESSVGRAEIGVTGIEDRNYIEMPYTQINSKIGCDLPWTIQLVENNLVWCNTEQGVHYLRSSSAALENEIVGISKKVNGSEYQAGGLTATRNGLLHDVRMAAADAVCSLDDEVRYWVVANGHAYVWDYQLSSYSEPSWFYFTEIAATAFCVDETLEVFHLNADGQVTAMRRNFNDYGGAIYKAYQFAGQNFDHYDRYKNINSIILAVRSDTDTSVDIKYLTDWEERYDLTPITAYSWRLVPRNLVYRFLGVPKYATVARRRPGCRNVRHFALRLENNIANNDLSVISAQIFYNFQGRQR